MANRQPDTEHLRPKWIKELQPWVNEAALQKIRLHSSPRINRWLQRFGLFGIVFGVNAYVVGFEHKGYWSVPAHRVMHEAVHIEQIEKWGKFRFYAAYVLLYPFFALMQSLRQMPFEKRAYDVQYAYSRKQTVKLIPLYPREGI